MTATATSDPGSGGGTFVKYTLLQLRPEWRLLGVTERTTRSTDWIEALEHPPRAVRLRTYSTVGLKAGAEMLLWMFSPTLEGIQEFHARLAGTPLGPYIETRYSYLGMTRRSRYLGGHSHAGQDGAGDPPAPADRRYLFVYPFVKRRDWYSIAFEERRRIMAEHFQVGHRFPGVQIHTGYSFGLDDAEFILAFESDSPSDFLDLVEALRSTEASRYTAVETPIFTGVKVAPRRLLELAEGLA